MLSSKTMQRHVDNEFCTYEDYHKMTFFAFDRSDYTFHGVGLLRYFVPGFIKETVRPFASRTFDFSEGKDTISDLLKWAEECEKRV